jgi:hypothetical protein
MRNKATVLSPAARNYHVVLAIALAESVAQINEFGLAYRPVKVFSFVLSKIAC